MVDIISADFLAVKSGDFVVVEDDLLMMESSPVDWWLGHVIHVIGGARDPSQTSLLQVADVDTGRIKTINADLVKGILSSNGLVKSQRKKA